MSGKLVAEDVPDILEALRLGRSKNSIARDYNVAPGMIRLVQAGWVPKTRAEIEELRERQRIGRERGLALWPRRINPVEHRARGAVHAALASGKLVRGACHCGEAEVEAHHHNGYDEAHMLDVVWLCNRHHKDVHVDLRASKPAPPASIRAAKADPAVPARSKGRLSREEVNARQRERNRRKRDEKLRLDTTGGQMVDRVDTSTTIASGETLVFGVDTHGSLDRRDWTPVERRPKPPFLAAPDDDCGACGHDRQMYHLDGVCRMPTGPRARCGCPAFVDPSEPF